MRLATAVSFALGMAVALAAQGQELEKRAWSPEGARTATQDLQDVSASLRSTLDRTGMRSEVLRSELDRFTQEAEALLLAVESGKSRDEVRPLYKQLRASRLALAEKVRLSGISLSQADIDAFQAVFEELETYFRQ